MSKGEQTRQTILEQAMQMFGIYGYVGTSMDDLVEATHLTKGGIYNHFKNKDALSLAAFDYATGVIQERYKERMAGKRTTRDRLLTVIDLFRSLLEDPLFPGGCPLLSTAVEADDTHPALRARAQQAADDWQQTIIRTLNKGLELGDVLPGTQPEVVATIIIATLEGAIMLSKLYGDTEYMHRAVDHLSGYIETVLRPVEQG